MFLDNRYLPLMTKPTRVTHTSSTLIDNIFVRSKRLMPNKSYIITDCMSDHYPCFLSYLLFEANTKANPIVVEKRKLTEEALFKIQHKLLHHNWSVLYDPDLSVDDSYCYLSYIIRSAMDECAPIRTVKIVPDECFHEP